MNWLHALARLVAALLVLPAGTAAAAQLYKWVDERGVVNYSNQPPADPKSAKKVTDVEDRVSVYTPDPALVREMAMFRQRASEMAYERPEAPPAVVMLGTSSPSPTMVYAAYGDDFPYWVGGGYWGHRPQPHHAVPQIRLRPGAIAGNMVENGLIPGNTAQLFPPPPTSRPRFDDPRPMPFGGNGRKR